MKLFGIRSMILVGMALLLAMPTATFAMMHGMEGGKGPSMMGPGMHGGMMGGMGPGGQMSGEMMPGTMPMMGRGHVMGYASPLDMKEDLKLTPEQTAKLKPIQTEYRKATIRKSAEIKVATLDLEELLEAKAIDYGKAEKQAKAIQGLKTDLLLYRIKTLQKIQGILTAEQFEKYRAKARRPMPHGMGMGPGMGMGMMCPMMQMMQQMMGGMMGPGMMGHGRPQPEKKAPAQPAPEKEKGAPPAKEEHRH